jgi:hypothetical protein
VLDAYHASGGRVKPRARRVVDLLFLTASERAPYNNSEARRAASATLLERVEEVSRMAFTTPQSRLTRPRRVGLMALATLVLWGILALAAGHGVAQEVLTNDAVVKMVKAGLPEAVIIQKIQTSERKFDTSTDGLVRLKSAGVPDRVIEAMMGAPARGTAPAAAPSAAAAGDPVISHMAGGSQRRLKSVVGNMEFKVEPFAGSRQEVVLPENKAQYRIAEKEPVFVAPNAATYQWILVRLKPGKRDRNLPMGGGGGWWTYEGTTYRHGVDPKYNIKLTTEAAPNGGLRIRPAEPLASGEYGFVAASRGQVNLVEVFDFAVE